VTHFLGQLVNYTEIEIWQTFSLSNAKIDRKRSQIVEISCP